MRSSASDRAEAPLACASELPTQKIRSKGEDSIETTEQPFHLTRNVRSGTPCCSELLGPAHHPSARVRRHHVQAESGQPDSELPCATGTVENARRWRKLFGPGR